MFIYEIASFYYDEKECDNICINDYLIHENQICKEEFTEMCNEGINIKMHGDCFTLKEYLINNYGFKRLNPIARFEFEEIQ